MSDLLPGLCASLGVVLVFLNLVLPGVARGKRGVLARWPVSSWLGLAARAHLGLVFLLACWHKLGDPEAFALQVASYQFLPAQLVNPFALALPWVELAAAVMLFLGLRARAAALLVVLMMVAFLVALVHALNAGLEMSCGCFAEGVGEGDPISGATVIRDGIWLALALYVLFLDRRPMGIDEWLTHRRSGGATERSEGERP